jgi:hypothetical protein
MTEQELRGLVREAIARHLEASGAPSHPRTLAPSHLRTLAPSHPRTLAPSHPSHALLPVLDGSQGDGPCIIEAAVMCNHCGYCKSYGH